MQAGTFAEDTLTACAGRGHRCFDRAWLSGEADGPSKLGEGPNQRFAGFVDVAEGAVVGEHGDVDLVDVTPDCHVEGAARRKYSDGIDFTHGSAAEMPALPWSRHGRHGDVESPVRCGTL